MSSSTPESESSKARPVPIDSWLNDQKRLTKRSDVKPYCYFSFAEFADTTEALTNLYYKRALSKALETDPKNTKIIKKALKKMAVIYSEYLYETIW